MGRETAEDRANDAVLKTVGNLLTLAGWRPLVAGPTKIEQLPGARKGHFRFIVEFTGSPPADSEKPWS